LPLPFIDCSGHTEGLSPGSRDLNHVYDRMIERGVGKHMIMTGWAFMLKPEFNSLPSFCQSTRSRESIRKGAHEN
jgi:hypothetical protein